MKVLQSIFKFILTEFVKYAETQNSRSTQSSNQQINPLPTGPNRLDIGQTLDSHTKQLEKMFNYLLLGFAILLVMVGTIVVSVFLDYKNSADQLHRDQYEFLEQQIQNLKITPTPNIIPTPTKHI